eukprot:scaffold5085_cov247-Pinguiococcus_pyrenoidosus.AAC.5
MHASDDHLGHLWSTFSFGNLSGWPSTEGELPPIGAEEGGQPGDHPPLGGCAFGGKKSDQSGWKGAWLLEDVKTAMSPSQ